MDNSILGVNVESLIKVSDELDKINNNINENLSFIKNEYANRLDEILYTNASQEYKKKTVEYLVSINKNININNTYFINKLKEIANIYNDLNNDIKVSVDGKVINHE